MNREILFRAYDKELNVMLHNVCPCNNNEIIIIDVAVNEAYGESIDKLLDGDRASYGGDEHCAISGLEIMQFTGLHDKNGTAIYEGDICEVHHIEYGSPIPDGYIGVVKYIESGFYVDNDKSAYPVFQEIAAWEVIGNVFENPELLTK